MQASNHLRKSNKNTHGLWDSFLVMQVEWKVL